MAKLDITRRDYSKIFERPTTETHEFRLTPFRGHVLEVTDVHFNLDSAVFLPDIDLQAPVTTCTDRYASGLAILRAALLHARRNPARKLLIVGHADTSGAASYNQPLSVKRANAVYHALMGNRAEWVTISHGQHKTEDYKRILQWVHYLWGWPCDPGPVNNTANQQSRNATKEFQKAYNVEFSASIAEDGDMGPQTWGAMFDVYMGVLKDMLLTDDAGLASLRSGLQFLDGARKSVGCGEHHPIDAPGINGRRSAINRRVEMLFFDPDEAPLLDCHPSASSCTPSLCEIYNGLMYRIVPFLPEPLPPYPPMQVSLQYGQVDKLFPTIAANTHTDPGIRARLQAIGFLYEALDGPSIATIASAAWDHFRDVFSQPTEAGAAAHLKSLVESTILDGNALPAPGAFKKVRLPGTYCITPANGDAFFNSPGAGAHSYRHFEETRIWTANPALGLIPIEAKVEARRNGRLSPAPAGVKVHFQLIPPDAVPATEAAPAPRATSVTGSVNSGSTFNMTGHPNQYVTTEKARNPGAAPDPQAQNAHNSVGGKRGNAAAGADHLVNVWETGTQHGDFHSGAPALNTGVASSHANAVMVETNAAGFADGILMPSWVGGDCYKVRAFLDPVCMNASNGTEGFAVKAETGTMVVWRILRFSRYLRWDYPAGVATAPTMGPLPTFDISGFIASEYKKSWMDVTVEPAATAPRAITEAEWRAGMRAAKAAVQARIASGSVTLTQPYNIAALFREVNQTAAIENVLSRAQYDAAIPTFPPRPGGWQTATGDASYRNNMAVLFHAIREEFLEHFTKNALSGVTIFQSPVISTLFFDPATPGGPYDNSGWGDNRRGCWVLFGQNAYTGPTAGMPYDHNANALHETGHVLYGVHQYTRAAQVNSSTGGNFDEHDYHDLCIMGYMRCQADFCGRCLLNHAGWDTRPMPANSPGP